MKHNKTTATNILKSKKYFTHNGFRSLQDQIIHYEGFMSDFLEMFLMVDFIEPFKQVNSTRELLVVVSNDDIDLNNILFQSILDKHYKNRDDIDLFCIGKDSLSFFIDSGFNVVGYSQLLGTLDENVSSSVYDYISVSIGDYGKICLLFNGIKSMLTKIPIEIDLLSLNQQNIVDSLQSIFVNHKKISIGQNNIKHILGIQKSEIGVELSLQLFQHIIYGVILQSIITELLFYNIKSGTNEDGLKDIFDWLNISFAEFYQLLLAQEVQKIMSEKS